MTKEELKTLLQKYRLGRCTEEELAIIDSFDSNLLKEHIPELGAEEELQLERKYLKTLEIHKGKVRPFRIISWPAVGIAASLVLLIASLVFLTGPVLERRHEMAFGQEAIEQMIVVKNVSSEQMVITLPDSSRVTLQPGASVMHDRNFSDSRRDVMLTGVAFFEVKRDENRPFSVYTGDVITKVLGTSFKVDASSTADSVTVSVVSGKVAVYQRKTFSSFKSQTILLPNQKAVFDPQKNVVSATLAENPQPLIPKAEIEKIKFENAPVSDVFAAFERIYGIDLVYDDLAFSGCYVKTSISGGEMFKRLGIICDAIGATYKVEGTRITIEGSGCF